jgi:hypothetical protein
MDEQCRGMRRTAVGAFEATTAVDTAQPRACQRAAQARLGHGADMGCIADGRAALVLTSPPYFPESLEHALHAGLRLQDDLETAEAAIGRFALSLRSVFEECSRVLCPGGVLVLQTRDVRVGAHLVAVEASHRALIESVGLPLFTRHTWLPSNPAPRRLHAQRLAAIKGQPRPMDPEVFLTFLKRGQRKARSASTPGAALLDRPHIETVRGTLTAPHRHQSPLPVLEAMILQWTDPGDLVVDPFMGGGSTLLVASRLERAAIGFDVDPGAVALTCSNLKTEAARGKD